MIRMDQLTVSAMTAYDAVKELQAEVANRRVNFGRMVASGEMDQLEMDERISIIEDVIDQILITSERDNNLMVFRDDHRKLQRIEVQSSLLKMSETRKEESEFFGN